MKPFGECKRIKHFSVLSLISVLIISYFSGCASPKVTIDLTMSTPIRPDSARSQWAVLTWCLETSEGQFLGLDTELAEKVRMDTGIMIFQNWCNDIALEFPFLKLMNGDLFFTGNVEDKTLIQKAVDKLERPIPIKPSLVATRGFFWAKNIADSGYPIWVRENEDALFLPEGKHGNRGLALKRLKEYAEAYIVGEIIMVAEAFAAKNHYQEAYEQLRGKANYYPNNSELLDYLDEVADLLSKQKLQSIIQNNLLVNEHSYFILSK